ncbi:MAG: hypothetical protein FWD25_03565 [Clostridia bacterium]|nr:hypothetical protein [Clostridia bacterium]
MKSRWVATLCVLALLLPSAAGSAPPQATLPPGLPASVTAPQAELPLRLFAPEARARSLKQAALSADAIAVSGPIDVGRSGWADALWHIDPATMLYSLVFEARQGIQILTPVWCGDWLYWVEMYEDFPGGWRIRSWNGQSGRTTLVREDPYPESAIVPALSTDGSRVYWYESGEDFPPPQPPYQRLNMALHALTPNEEEPQLLRRLDAQVDWQPPRVTGGVLAVGAYEQDRWWVLALDIESDTELARLERDIMPMDVQSNGQYMAWRQAADFAEDDEQRALGQQARDEEDPPLREHGFSGGQLWLADLNNMGAEPMYIDAGVDALLLRPEGVYYVTESRALCFYSFELGRVLRLTSHADYLPVLYADVDSNTLLALRAIDVGERIYYRAALIDVAALCGPGWPLME